MSWLIRRAGSVFDLDRDRMAVIHVVASDLSRHGELYQSESIFTAFDVLGGNGLDTPRVRTLVVTETGIDPDDALKLWQELRESLSERIPKRILALTPSRGAVAALHGGHPGQWEP